MEINSKSLERSILQKNRSRLIFLLLTVFLALFYTTIMFGATQHNDLTNISSQHNSFVENPYNSWSKINLASENSCLQKKDTITFRNERAFITKKKHFIKFNAVCTIKIDTPPDSKTIKDIKNQWQSSHCPYANIP